jgi:uncharacterized membrane protein YfcA
MATWRYHRAGLFELRPALPAVGAVFVGAMIGTLVVSHLKAEWLSLIVPVLLMAICLYTLLSPRMSDADAAARVSSRGYLPTGAAVGFMTAFSAPARAVLHHVAGDAARHGADARHWPHQTVQPDEQCHQHHRLCGRRQDPVAAGRLHGGGAMSGAWIGSHMASRLGAKVIRPLLVTVSLAMTGKLIWGWFAG